MTRTCRFCNDEGIVWRARLGGWACLSHAKKDAIHDAEHRQPNFSDHRITEYFVKKYGFPRGYWQGVA